MLFTLNAHSFIPTFYHATYHLWEIIEKSDSVSVILSLKFDCCILKWDPLQGFFFWDKEEFSTNLKVDTLNTGHTCHSEKEIPQAPQLKDGKGANYSGV